MNDVQNAVDIAEQLKKISEQIAALEKKVNHLTELAERQPASNESYGRTAYPGGYRGPQGQGGYRPQGQGGYRPQGQSGYRGPRPQGQGGYPRRDNRPNGQHGHQGQQHSKFQPHRGQR